jgi:anti-sigma B factor antagonist
MAEQLSIENTELTPGLRVLKLSGAFVLTTIFQFQQIVRADSGPSMIIDMTGVTYCDSAGIGALVNAQVSHTRNGRKLALRGVNARVMEVLKITRVDELFTFLPAESAASGTTP